jgi:glycosyltransferase involved in cell wall biosynthesis
MPGHALRILFLTPAFPPLLGGGERYAAALAAELAQRGHQITVLTSDARRESDFWLWHSPAPLREEQRDGLRILRVGTAGLRGGRVSLLAWRKAMVLLAMLAGERASATLARMARFVPALPGLAAALDSLAGPFDLVHGYNLSWEYPLVAGQAWARKRGLPLVITPFTHLGEGARDRVARNNTMPHQRHLLQDAAAVFTLTDVEREGLQRWGVDAARLVTIGGGVEPLPASTISADEMLRRYDLHPPLIAYVGRLSRDKGALAALEAVLRLRAQGVAVTLALVGQETSEFARAYRALSAAERRAIRPLGTLSEAEKHALLDASVLLTLPSHTDSFGIVFLEAWAHGLPVIGARAGGIPGVVDEGENGLLVPYGNAEALAAAMARLLRDPALAQQLGARGRAKVATHYQWRHVATRVEEVYQRVLAGREEQR